MYFVKRKPNKRPRNYFERETRVWHTSKHVHPAEMNNNGLNFGYTFGVPRSESNNEADSDTKNTQNSQSQDYLIDLSQITPATFRFGEFGQIRASGSSEEVAGTVDSVERAETGNSGDNDSFLAEPSISIGQFDASFIHNTFDAPQSVTSCSSPTSSTKVPVLVEELLDQPDFLEEPAAHSVEELLKATIDGDTAEVLKESWEDVGMDEIILAEAERVAYIAEKEESKTAEVAEVPEPVATEINEPVLTEATETNPDTETETKTKPEPKPTKPKATRATTTAKPAKPAKSITTATKTAKPGKPAKVSSPTETSIVVGKRQRKTVERLTDTIVQPVKPVPEKGIQIPKGSGTKLGDIEVIKQNLNRKLGSDKTVTALHKIVFDRVGEARNRKSNLRSFCGSESVQNYEAKLKKFTNADLNEMTVLLGLSGGNEKTALATKISNFLVKPSAESCADTKKKKTTLAVASKNLKATKRANATTSKGKAKKVAKVEKILTPEFIDSDVESDVEREVLHELKKGKGKN